VRGSRAVLNERRVDSSIAIVVTHCALRRRRRDILPERFRKGTSKMQTHREHDARKDNPESDTRKARSHTTDAPNIADAGTVNLAMFRTAEMIFRWHLLSFGHFGFDSH
jgi:hypothetical protein